MMIFHVTCGRFSAGAFGDCKRITVEGPSDFGLAVEIDFDDVAQDEVYKQTVKLLDILDRNWQ